MFQPQEAKEQTNHEVEENNKDQETDEIEEIQRKINENKSLINFKPRKERRYKKATLGIKR